MRVLFRAAVVRAVPASRALGIALVMLLFEACRGGLAGIPGPPSGEFHWPPPQPTTLLALSAGQRSSIDSCKTHFGVAARIRDALDRAGYVDRRWYLVSANGGPVGFVVTTRLEQIQDDGTSKSGAERWSEKFPAADALGFIEYLKQLVLPVKGHYRVVLIAVTSLPMTSGAQAPTLRVVNDWLKEGTADIPPTLHGLTYAPDEGVALYVYEFSSHTSDEPAVFMDSSQSSLTGAAHLEKSGIGAQLKEDTSRCQE